MTPSECMEVSLQCIFLLNDGHVNLIEAAATSGQMGSVRRQAEQAMQSKLVTQCPCMASDSVHAVHVCPGSLRDGL